MKKIISTIIITLLFLPLTVNAASKNYTISNFDEANNSHYFGRLKTTYDNFIFEKYDPETDDYIFYKYKWDKTKKQIDEPDYDDLASNENEIENFDIPGIDGRVSAVDRTLSLEEDPLNPGSYRSFAIYGGDGSHEANSDYIYSSSTIGTSVGYIDDEDNFSAYELKKIGGGYDYRSNIGDIVFSANDNGYKVSNISGYLTTFMNETNIITVYYTFGNSSTIYTTTTAALKALLDVDDLTGIKVIPCFKASDNELYIRINLNSSVYLINSNTTKIIYQRELQPKEKLDFYGNRVNGKDYLLVDLYKNIDEDSFTQILTEVFDFAGKKYFDNKTWKNLYFSNFNTLYGVTTENGKDYGVFMEFDGTVIYKADLSSNSENADSSKYYGYILTSDHKTTTLTNGKYLLYLQNTNFDIEFENYFTYKILTVSASIPNPKTLDNVSTFVVIGITSLFSMCFITKFTKKSLIKYKKY